MMLVYAYLAWGLGLGIVLAWLAHGKEPRYSVVTESIAIVTFCILCMLAWPAVLIAGWYESRRRSV